MGFKPKDNTGVRILQQKEVTFSQEQFVEDVFNDDYILVVGSEVVMNREEEPSGDVNQYILRALNSSLGRDYKDFNELVTRSGEGIDAIRNLLNSEEDWTYDINDIAPELKELLETRLFRFVLTTTFDGYMELLMEHVWGKGNYRVVNIDDKRSLDALRNTLVECRDGRRYTEPTLFYIFGKAVKDEAKKFVRTDDDAIQIVEKWIQMPKEDPVLRHIRNKKLLALGCKFDNWYFRFFWYILKREISRLREGQVAFILNTDSQIDNKLESFLRHAKIYRHNDSRVFMADITRMLTSTEADNPFHELILKSRKRGGVFLSYCSKDVIMASQVFFMLRRQGYNVWFDNVRLQGGDNYNHEIEDAIGEAKVFIPLLTPHIAEDLKNGRTANYYNKEWRMATQLGNKRILPLATNGYDLRADYHSRTFESIIGGSLSGIDLMKGDGFSRLIESLNTYLNV